MNYFNKIKTEESGFIFLLVIVFTGFFLIFFGGMITVALMQQKLYTQQTAKQQALHMAEAGVNYYAWHLAHDNEDFYDGTGSDPGDVGVPYGPYEHNFAIPNSDLDGFFNLMIYPPEDGSNIVTIRSEGWVSNFPNIKRTVEAKYGAPSLGNYSFLTNSDVWFGEGESTIGRVHSNGGVRMDGSNDSTVTSARDEYICYSGHGCSVWNCNSPCEWSGGNCNCPGVWGDGLNSNLWSFPENSIDFDSITFNIADMKNKAQAEGNYFAQSSNGYHIVFKSDGTFDAYEVDKVEPGLKQLDDDWNDSEKKIEEMKSEIFINNYIIPGNGLIFIEDEVWVEGVVAGRATLISAVLPDSESTRTTIFINNNLTYLNHDGSNILGLIAQKDIKVPRHAPSNLVIDGMVLAQHGRVFRNYYEFPVVKASIEVYGSIITNKTWNWTWISGSDSVIDGYIETNSIYDPQINNSPPPFFPTFGSHEFISWEENSWQEY